MGDTAVSSPPDTSERWLAAYALGLAYSDNSDEQRLTDLIAAARGHQRLLEAAHRRLDGADIAERSPCDVALRLLERAMAT